MEKIELKHLACYLPYGLKGISHSKTIFLLDTYSSMGGGLQKRDIYSFLGLELKPLLRPLSDLIKEIEHKGEKIIPIEKLECEGIDYIESGVFGIKLYPSKENEWIWYIDIYNNIQQKLFELHFDVYGLIEKGLAIDINTLNK